MGFDSCYPKGPRTPGAHDLSEGRKPQRLAKDSEGKEASTQSFRFRERIPLPTNRFHSWSKYQSHIFRHHHGRPVARRHFEPTGKVPLHRHKKTSYRGAPEKLVAVTSVDTPTGNSESSAFKVRSGNPDVPRTFELPTRLACTSIQRGAYRRRGISRIRGNASVSVTSTSTGAGLTSTGPMNPGPATSPSSRMSSPTVKCMGAIGPRR